MTNIIEKSGDKKFETVVVTSPSFSKNKILTDELSLIARNVIVNSKNIKFDEDSLALFINEHRADGAVIGTDPLSDRVIQKLNTLLAIGKYGVGCDNVDIPSLQKKGIYFGWEGGVNRRSVAELTLGFMLGHQRNLFRSIDQIQNGHWQKNGGFELTGKTVGIVGFGYIGKDLAKLLAPFGCQLLVHDIEDKSTECRKLNAVQVDFQTLLRTSDFVTLHVPGGQATKHLLGGQELSHLKKTALVINTSRGDVVDFSAAVKALRAKFISGYAADVFPDEPLVSTTYKVEDGFYFTPHIGGNTAESVLAMGRSAIRGLRAYLENSGAD